MGKIRNKRHTHHTSAPKLEDDETATNLTSSAKPLLKPVTSNLVCIISLFGHKKNLT